MTQCYEMELNAACYWESREYMIRDRRDRLKGCLVVSELHRFLLWRSFWLALWCAKKLEEFCFHTLACCVDAMKDGIGDGTDTSPG